MSHQYKEHPSLTCQLVDERLVPVPGSPEANTTVWFALPTESGGDQVWEGLLAYQPDGSEHAQLRSVPLFAYDLNYGDHVAVIASAEGALVATAVVSDSGNYTFRIWSGDTTAGALGELVMEFAQMGCLIEGYSEHLVGPSCERPAAQTVADALMAGEQAGRFEYETGRQTTH